jgi:uncharacterized membrane protein
MAGSATTVLLVFSMMRRATTVQEVRVLARLGSLVEKVFPAASLVLLLSGAYLVNELGWHWSDGWVSWSALALIIATAIGGLVNAPRMNAIHKASDAAPDGPVPSSLSSLLNDPILFGSIHALSLVVLAIIWNMTTKPGGVEAFLAIVLLAAIGAGSAYPLYQRQQARAPR